MRKSAGSRWLELALWGLGISLLGGALLQTLFRWNYQAQQTRALDRGPAVSVIAPNRLPAPPAEPARAAAKAPAKKMVEREAVARVLAKDVAKEVAKDVDDDDPDPAFARIEIPRIGIAAIVEEGTDAKTLARAVGLVGGSARPGETGNMVLAGHRDTFFRPLRKIRVNDRIRMVVPPNTYEYEVRSLRVVAPEETSVLQSKGVEELTLVTCYPFRFVGPAPDRFIVSAARVD
jgi:sortase A